MVLQSISSNVTLTHLFVGGLVTILASNTITFLLTYWLVTRKTLPKDLNESEARTYLAHAHSTQSIAETLEIVSSQLREANEALEQTTARYNDRTLYIEFLELEVQRAAAAGFLARAAIGGKGRNPAA